MRTLSVSLTPDDLDMIEAVISHVPMASRHAVARAALRAGLDQMVRDQSYALDRLLLERRHAAVGA